MTMLKSESRVTPSVFVPVTDELIFDTPELIEGPLVPYSSGMACHGWLSIELNPDDDVVGEFVKERAAAKKPSLGLLNKVGTVGNSVGQKVSERARLSRAKIKLAYSS